MSETNTLYAVYRATAVPDETYPEYNAGYNLDLVGYKIVSDDEPDGIDPEEFEMRPVGVLPKESKIC